MDILDQTPIINTQVLTESPKMIAPPLPSKKSPLIPILIGIVIVTLLGAAAFFAYQYFTLRSQLTVMPTPTPTQTQIPINTSIDSITDTQLQAGWYWGSKDQKLSGTPANWIYLDAGRSSCWHEPESSCMSPGLTKNFECPTTEWVDCMPGPGLAKPECQSDYLDWAKDNCPGFQGAAF